MPELQQIGEVADTRCRAMTVADVFSKDRQCAAEQRLGSRVFALIHEGHAQATRSNGGVQVLGTKARLQPSVRLGATPGALQPLATVVHVQSLRRGVCCVVTLGPAFTSSRATAANMNSPRCKHMKSLRLNIDCLAR
jgi:hypothetical protein